MNYIDCKSVAQKWKDEVRQMPGTIRLGIIQVGHDPASDAYVRGKLKDAEEVGIVAIHHHIEAQSSAQVMSDILLGIRELFPNVDGLIVQLPLPFGLDLRDIRDILPDGVCDVDGLTEDAYFLPCTTDGILHLLEELNIDVDGKHCVVIGRSELVTKPLAKELQDQNATVTVCHSHTPSDLLGSLAGLADIVVSAVGRPVLGTSAFKPGAVVIDVGIHRVDGKLKGDIFVDADRDDIQLTPVPGGVGLLTRAMLMKHVAQSYRITHTNAVEVYENDG